jgi:phosphoadenosine phosphosulfate reductase
MTAITIQQDLNGKSFEDVAIANIQKYEPDEGYYLAFSGGKDSIVIYDLAVRAGVKFDAHFSRTTVDPPEVLKFIKENYPWVIWEKPRMSMFQLIRKKKMLPTRIIRFCCSELKEIGGSGRVVMTGVRKAESSSRKHRRMYEESKRVKGKIFLHPIIEWSDQDVWDYIQTKSLKYCSLYDEGKKRIGCILCPMQGPKGMRADAERWPKYYKAYLRAIDRVIKSGRRWQGMTADEVMDWWIDDN